MNVQMWHGLPSCWTVIDANVVPMRLKLFAKRQLGSIKQSQKVTAFLSRQVKKRGCMPLGNQQGVTGRNRVSIPDGYSGSVFVYHPAG